MLELLTSSQDVAVDHLNDWNAGAWLIAGGIFIAAIVWSIFALPAVGVLSDGIRPSLAIVGGIGWVALSIAAALSLLILPGDAMRHLPAQGNVLWIVLLCVLVAAGLGIAWYNDHPWLWLPAALVLIGAVGGAAIDWINRVAAAIPTTVGGLVLIGIIIVAVLWSKARE